MELRDIEYFAVVAEHGHLGRAAEALGLSHPALSKSLRRLERSVQAKLVQRTPKGVELTAEGTALLSHVRALRLSLADVTREIAALSQGRVGHLRIGVGPGVAPQLIPKACSALLKDGAKTTFKVIVETGDVLVPALRKGEYDLIVTGILSSPPEGLTQEVLYDDEFVVVASTHHRFANAKTVTIGDLSHEQWVLSPANVVSWQLLHRAFEDHRLPPPHVALESNSTSVRLQAVSCSELLGFGARRFQRQATRELRLVELPVKDISWSRRVGVSYRKDAYLSPLARRFIELLKSTAQDIVKET